MARTAPASARTERAWLLRHAPSLVAVEVALLVAVVFLLARSTLGILVGGVLIAVVLVLVAPVFGGRSLVGWLRLRWAYGRRRPDNAAARRADPGQIVGAAQPVLQLAALTTMEAQFQTPDTPLLAKAMGAPVTIRPLDQPGMLDGHVTDIAPLVNPETGSVTIKAGIDGGLDPSLLGAAVEGRLSMLLGTGIKVPWTALTSSGGSAAVWLVGADDRVSIAPITILRFQTDAVIVGAGLAPGQTVVGRGSQLLFPGRRVTRGTVDR